MTSKSKTAPKGKAKSKKAPKKVAKIDFEKAFGAYYPVIACARKLIAFYNGQLDGVPKMAPQIAGELYQVLQKAEKDFPIVIAPDEKK